MPTHDDLSHAFGALADPTRRDILTRLGHGSETVGGLAAPYAISLPAVSRHLKVLERAGLITRVRDAQTLHNQLRPAGLLAVRRWVDGVESRWGERFERLEQVLASPEELRSMSSSSKGVVR